MELAVLSLESLETEEYLLLQNDLAKLEIIPKYDFTKP